jgi:hypothetical protein
VFSAENTPENRAKCVCAKCAGSGVVHSAARVRQQQAVTFREFTLAKKNKVSSPTDGRTNSCYHCVSDLSHCSKKGSFMESDAVGDQRTEDLRKTVFLALVEAQDNGIDVVQSRKLMIERFSVTEAQLREIEREGLDREWPPL